MKTFLFASIILLQACSSKNEKKLFRSLSPNRVEIFRLNNAYWAYSIYREDTITVNQTSLPGFRGNYGIPDSLTAFRIASLANHKIELGQMPPSIDKDEILGLWPMNSPLPEAFALD